jgi:hypothetical protein
MAKSFRLSDEEILEKAQAEAVADRDKTIADATAERKRVDDFYNKGRHERANAKVAPKKKSYPAAIHVMGQGFKNLYDSLGGNQ